MLVMVSALPDHDHFARVGYVLRLIGRFRSLDAAERASLAQLVLAVRNARPNLSERILRQVLFSVMDYIDRQQPPHVVGPALMVAM
jgi:hypothetical protein